MMKNISPKQKSQNKAMAVAIIFGLLAIGTAAFIGIKNTMTDIENQKPNTIDQTASLPDESAEWRTPDTAKLTEEETAQTITTPEEPQEKESSKPNTLTGFVLPVEGNIITPYSDGKMVKSLTLNDWRTHDGVDIAAKEGTPVKACNAGKVSSIDIDPMWGTTIVITHADDSTSYYMGLNKSVRVSKGQQVALGEAIGTVGKTAEIEQALESHLHFAMKKDGNWINPIQHANK